MVERNDVYAEDVQPVDDSSVAAKSAHSRDHQDPAHPFGELSCFLKLFVDLMSSFSNAGADIAVNGHWTNAEALRVYVDCGDLRFLTLTSFSLPFRADTDEPNQGAI